MENIESIIENAKKANGVDSLLSCILNFEPKEDFDAIVFAPSWNPYKILKRVNSDIECLLDHDYFSTYKVRLNNKKIAWVQCAPGSNNIIDYLLPFAESKTNKIIFIGSAGALKENIKLGELATPSESYGFDGGSVYLENELNGQKFGEIIKPHNQEFMQSVLDKAKYDGIDIKQCKVFCTNSIMMEYSHMDFIKSTGADLIEMETAAFYKCVKMMRKDGFALLCVSDNSAANISLIKKTDEEYEKYYNSREIKIPKIIELICNL